MTTNGFIKSIGAVLIIITDSRGVHARLVVIVTCVCVVLVTPSYVVTALEVVLITPVFTLHLSIANLTVTNTSPVVTLMLGSAGILIAVQTQADLQLFVRVVTTVVIRVTSP